MQKEAIIINIFKFVNAIGWKYLSELFQVHQADSRQATTLQQLRGRSYIFFVWLFTSASHECFFWCGNIDIPSQKHQLRIIVRNSKLVCYHSLSGKVQIDSFSEMTGNKSLDVPTDGATLQLIAGAQYGIVIATK